MVDKMMKKIKEEAEKNYPQESCGLVLKSGKKSITVACKNISSDPRSNFTICPIDYAKATELGEVVGIWHTHVEIPPRASDADKVGCERSGLPWYIVSIRKNGEEFEFEGPNRIEPEAFEMPYLERPYEENVFNCYSIVQDYYKREFGITLSDRPFFLNDGTPAHTTFKSAYSEEGFVRLHDEEPKNGDVFMMQISANDPNHLGVYVGAGVFLHHQTGRLSRKDIYGGFWKKHTTHHLRHKDMMK